MREPWLWAPWKNDLLIVFEIKENLERVHHIVVVSKNYVYDNIQKTQITSGKFDKSDFLLKR